MKVRLVRIRGRVQGVWYRAWAVEEATRRGLRGWIRNRRDGSVEALLAGEDAKVEDMILACRQGPPLAKVDSISSEAAVGDPPEGFQQRATA
jgi:acylphosphatase